MPLIVFEFIDELNIENLGTYGAVTRRSIKLADAFSSVGFSGVGPCSAQVRDHGPEATCASASSYPSNDC
jgi:hypothetical protein